MATRFLTVGGRRVVDQLGQQIVLQLVYTPPAWTFLRFITADDARRTLQTEGSYLSRL